MIYEFIYGEKSDLLCIFESIGSVLSDDVITIRILGYISTVRFFTNI